MPKPDDSVKALNRLKVLVDLLENTYPESALVRVLKKDEDVGDGLAEFIVNELGEAMHSDTWEGCLADSSNMLETAIDELVTVKAAIDALYAKEQEVREPV